MTGFVYNEKPLRIAGGDGMYLYDDAGNEYLDAGASYACVPVGHGHPAVVGALTEQLETLGFVHGSYPNDARDVVYDRLADLAPGDLDHVWLCNSGTEANEAAIKFARSATGRSTIVAAKNGFHGRTYGSLSATWKPAYRAGYEPLVGDVEFVDYDDPEALADAVDDETAAVLLEPIQGEGGIKPASKEFLAAAREYTADVGAALVFDEIQTGLGRTGNFWACQAADVVPDVITAAKGLANGLPVGATVCAEWVADGVGSHGATFSGGPAVCAATDATLSVIEDEELVDNAAAAGDRIATELEAADLERARDVRGAGLLIGIELKRGANAAVRDLALDHGVLAIPAGRTVVRILPPLVVDDSHVDAIVAALVDVLGEAE